jgi:Cu(I)/Ag(I) efflux system protein CusF
MKAILVSTLLAGAVTFAGSFVYAQSGEMKGMDMKGMDHKSMAKGGKESATHTATGTVKKLDAKAGTVTLAHDPVKSLEWPAMTMKFKVKDKALVEKLKVDRKVTFEFAQQGKDYVVTAVK